MNNTRSAFLLLLLLGILLTGDAVLAQQPAPIVTTAPMNSASTAPPSTQPLLGFTTRTVPIELPSLSGRLPGEFAYSFHGQTTIIPQFHGDFASPYQGSQSFEPNKELATSYTGTLFMGVRLRPGTEVYFNPEVSAGLGLSTVLGLGNPPNGDVPRLPNTDPLAYVARLYLHQSLGFGGEQDEVADGANVIAGRQDVNRLIVTVGQLAANDIFDGNLYAHDPRSQFMNWGLWENTAWDYAGDIQGYSQGLALELNSKAHTLRYGIFRPPQNANGGRFDTHWNRAFDQVAEYEQRYNIAGLAGAVRPMIYINYSHMGDYRQAVLASPIEPNIIAYRSYSHPKYGAGINFQQCLTHGLSIFGRAGWNNGQSESFAFTEVDRMLSLGLSLRGGTWERPDDVIGIGGVLSGLGKDHRDYLAAGGLGLQLGDGRLSYAPEEVIEAYYQMVLTRNLFLSADYQFLNHPGFNADRGPVSIGAARVHLEF